MKLEYCDNVETLKEKKENLQTSYEMKIQTNVVEMMNLKSKCAQKKTTYTWMINKECAKRDLS
jgi:hypothetical protein